MCFENWCPKTEFAYLIGCHNENHFKLILKNPCWQPIKCAISVFGYQLLKHIERPFQRHNFSTKVTPGKISLFWKMAKRASHFIKLIKNINIKKVFFAPKRCIIVCPTNCNKQTWNKLSSWLLFQWIKSLRHSLCVNDAWELSKVV